jgi:GAF domain-containing protein
MPFRCKVPEGITGALAAFSDITDRHEAEAALRAESARLETLNQTGAAIASEIELEQIVQTVTDAGVALTGAAFGAFFYNVTYATGERLTLYTISGVPREHSPSSDAAQHGHLRADAPRSADRAVGRHHQGRAVWEECSPPRHARGTPAGSELPGRPGGVALG